MWDEPSGMESLAMNKDKGIRSIFFDGGIWLALFMVWLLFSASGFMGGTLAARVTVLILMVFKRNFKRKGPHKFVDLGYI